jgi:hypothetical protein
MNNYDLLISRLDAFIRKYYANQLIRGGLILLICLLFYVLTVSVSEYFLYLPVVVKISIVGLFIVAGLAALVLWVIIPLSRMARLGKIISHEQAALIIGRHFPEVSDKLLNILQLRKQSEYNSSRDLIFASIDQKASQISVVPIGNAIDLKKNRRYLPYLAPLVLIAIVIMVAAPSIFIDASERLLQPTRAFEKPAPFKFVIISQPLRAVRNTDFILKVKAEGNTLPAEISLQIGDDRIPMLANADHSFQYSFKNVTEPVKFRLFGAGFYSETYTLKVAQKPVLKSFSMMIDYPDYTGKKDETRSSMGDITVPVGTRIVWDMVAEHTDRAMITFGNSGAALMPGGSGKFGFKARFLSDTSYTITLGNNQSAFKENYSYNVQVIPDQYPVIQLQELRDTVTGKQVLLNGTAGDDYGIKSVLFHYQVTDDKNHMLSAKVVPLKGAAGTLASFEHYFDIDALNLQKGQKLSYFIEAWDNDGVHGSKASRSETMMYMMYDAKQLDSAINANAEQISSGISNSAQQTKQLQTEFKDMQSKMLQSDKLDWEQQQSIQDLAQKQMQLQSQMENTKKKFEEQIQQSKQKEYSEDVRDKQEDLKKQMDNLLNNELKEQMKKLEELMKKLNKDNAFQTMQQLEQENKLFNMDLQRMQELMNKLEMQMRMEDLANKMEQLAKEQLDLKDQTDKNKKDNDALGKEQEGLKKELDKAMKEDMKEMNGLNDKLQQKQDMDKMEQKAGEAGKNMQDSKDELGQKQNSKSSKSQSKAAQNLQDMAAALKQAAGGMEMEQIEMDIKAVRQILTNLMRLSFDQEQLMKKVQYTQTSSTQYLTNQKEQDRLHNNSKMIRDSLFSLSKRLSKLSATVNRETTELEKNMKYAVSALEDRRIGEGITKQQFVMTRTNNLALMLNEMLSNLMQMQSEAQNPRKGQCNNPGGKTPKPGAGQQLSDIISKQKQLGEGMQPQDGKSPGKDGDKPGQKGQNGSDGGEDSDAQNAEQIARMAQQQAAIRRQLAELNSLLNSKGMGNAKEIKEIQEKMDRNETDLVNRRMTSELMMRHRDIMTRLLETEKAIREQEQDDKRSSKTPGDISRPIPAELQKQMKDRQNLLELYKTVPPQLKPYYRTMVDDYYRMIGTGKSN